MMKMADPKIELLFQLLDEMEGDETHLEGLLARFPEHSEELLPLLQLARRLEVAPPVEPGPEFRRVARARLLARLSENSPVTFGRRLRHIWQTSILSLSRRTAMTWILIITTLVGLLAGGGGVAYASSDALPGDGLYPVKMTIEVARLGLADDAGDFGLYMKYADTRLSEFEGLIEAGRFEELPVAAQGFEDSLQNLERLRAELGPQGEAYGEGQAIQLRERLESHARLLNGLLGSEEEIIPLQAQQQIRQMIQVVVRVQNYGPPDDAGPNGDGPPDEAGPQGAGAPEDAGPNGEGPPDAAGPPDDAGQPDGNNNQGDGAPVDPGQNGQGAGGQGNGNGSSGGSGQNGGG